MDTLSAEAGLSFQNRSEGLRAVNVKVNASQALGQPHAVIWLNLDRFRQINASFGHAGGDQVIVEVVRRIHQRLGSDQLIARMDGDEFLCLLSNCTSAQAEKTAYALLHDISKPLQIDGVPFRPSASVGVAFSATDSDASMLVERADRAMMDAKRLGGGRLVAHTGEAAIAPAGKARAREALVTENDLHTALENGGLTLNYQPIIGFDGHIEAFEALMRCNVNGREIPPGAFIPVAEQTGLIVRLGEWCLMEGARFAARLRREWRPARIAINVSRAQITSDHFMTALHGALICSDIAPEFIELEITESLFMEMSHTVNANLRSVRDIGLGLSIDDFGTGFSCLSNLKDLPATKLKLDRAFVEVLPQDRKAYAVVRAMSSLARDLGLMVVAEGVETQEQVDCLRGCDVDAVQGYLYSHPLSDATLLEWLPQSGFH